MAGHHVPPGTDATVRLPAGAPLPACPAVFCPNACHGLSIGGCPFGTAGQAGQRRLYGSLASRRLRHSHMAGRLGHFCRPNRHQRRKGQAAGQCGRQPYRRTERGSGLIAIRYVLQSIVLNMPVICRCGRFRGLKTLATPTAPGLAQCRSTGIAPAQREDSAWVTCQRVRCQTAAWIHRLVAAASATIIVVPAPSTKNSSHQIPDSGAKWLCMAHAPRSGS